MGLGGNSIFTYITESQRESQGERNWSSVREDRHRVPHPRSTGPLCEFAPRRAFHQMPYETSSFINVMGPLIPNVRVNFNAPTGQSRLLSSCFHGVAPCSGIENEIKLTPSSDCSTCRSVLAEGPVPTEIRLEGAFAPREERRSGEPHASPTQSNSYCCLYDHLGLWAVMLMDGRYVGPLGVARFGSKTTFACRFAHQCAIDISRIAYPSLNFPPP